MGNRGKHKVEMRGNVEKRREAIRKDRKYPLDAALALIPDIR